MPRRVGCVCALARLSHMASLTAPTARTSHRRATSDDVSAPPSPVRRARDVWRYRELLASLVRKELKVKYKNSVLGFFWSMLNPALTLVVFGMR